MQIRTTAFALVVLALLAVPAVAQERSTPQQTPSRMDIVVGFGGDTRLGDADPGWRSGLRLSVDVNFTDRVSLVVIPALGVAVGTMTGSQFDYAFLTGPRVRFGAKRRVTPFVQALAGVQHGVIAPPHGIVPAAPPDRGTAFLMSFGGGFDVALTPRFAWRAIQVEERSEFGELNVGHHVAVSTGLVIRFGRR